MINGRILISTYKIHRIVCDMVAYADDGKALSLLENELADHCVCWHFGTEDQKTIRTLILKEYAVFGKFFTSQNQSGT